jgi:hypothetical protein
MKTFIYIVILLVLNIPSSCTNGLLPEIFWQYWETKILALDISIYFKIDKKHLTADQQTALAPFDKIEYLSFKLNDKTKNSKGRKH